MIQPDVANGLELVAALQACVGADYVYTDGLEAWSGDETEVRAQPDVVVEPATTQEVAAVVQVAQRYRMPLITRGAGSGLAGGAVPQGGGIVVSLVRMQRTLEIDGPAMTV